MPQLGAMVPAVVLAVSFTDRERPYTVGSVGAYTQDARAEFRDIVVSPESEQAAAQDTP